MSAAPLPNPVALELRLLATVAGTFGLGSIIINLSLPSGQAWQSPAVEHPLSPLALFLPIALLLLILLGTLVASWPCVVWLRAKSGGPQGVSPKLTAAARGAALGLPSLALRAGLPLVIGTAVLRMLEDVRLGVPVVDAAHLAAVSSTIGTALSVPVYILLRSILRPVLLLVGATRARGPARLELRPRLLWAVPALTLTAAGPPALVAAARMRVQSPGAELAVMLLGLGLLLGVAAWMAVGLAKAIRTDVDRLTRRITALAHRKPTRPAQADRLHLDELKRLVEAVNKLLARNAELDAAHFVAIERLLEAEQLKVRFLAHMSHDLRAPLNTVVGFADVLLGGVDGALAPQTRQTVESIRNQSERALRIVSQVLELARVEAGGMQLRRESSPAAEIVSQAVQDARAAGDRGIDIVTSLQPGIAPLFVDGARLSTALGGLLGYALEEVDEGPLELTVEATGKNELRTLDVRLSCASLPVPNQAVEDPTGAMRHLPRRRDLGLGPVLAQRIVELHGGTLTVEPGPDESAVFHIKVPG